MLKINLSISGVNSLYFYLLSYFESMLFQVNIDWESLVVLYLEDNVYSKNKRLNEISVLLDIGVSILI